MDAITFIAEERILRAQEEGAFDGLPGAGKPIAFGVAANIPPDLRMAYTLLKNSGCLEEGTLPHGEMTLRQCLPKAESEAYTAGIKLEIGLNRVERPRRGKILDRYYSALCGRFLQTPPLDTDGE